MNFENELLKWQFFFAKRQLGHTHAALHGVLNTDNAVLVCANEKQLSLFPKGKAINFNTTSIDPLLGFKNPVVFDNFTLSELINKSLSERIDKDKAKQEKLELIHKFEEVVRECCNKGLATGFILSTGIPNLRIKLNLQEYNG